MKKITLTSILAIAFAMPAVCANIPNDATCNSGVLGVSSGSANLEADYTANTINITWNSNGGSTPTGGATSCTYDSTFNLPTAPTKTGYTFAGWAVAQNCFANITIPDGFYPMNYAMENAVYSSNSYNGTWSGDLILQEDHAATIAEYGHISGISKCSSTPGTDNQPGNPSDTNGAHCWCKILSFTPIGGSECTVSSPVWVYSSANESDLGSEAACYSSCAETCGNYPNTDPFLPALE